MRLSDVKLGENHENGFYLWPAGQEPILCQWKAPKIPTHGRQALSDGSTASQVIVRFSRHHVRVCQSLDAARAIVANHFTWGY